MEIVKVLLGDTLVRSLLQMPVPYTNIVPAANADTRADAVSFELSSPTCPPKVVTLSLGGTAPASVVSARRCHSNLSEAAFDVRMVRCESSALATIDTFFQESFVARDGTKIPATVVLSRSASARPTLVRAYGAYGQSLPTAFKYEDVPLLLRGWNIIFLHVRGGGELGPVWHEQGRKLLKATSSNDVVDGVLWLRHGILSDRVDRIVLEAYSAGALSVATAACDPLLRGSAPQSPSTPMISALLLLYAFVDPLSAMMDASLSLTVHERDEWGDPIAHEATHELLESISPYHRVLKGQVPACPVLLINSAIDVRVQPWQQAKFVLALRSALQNSQNNCLPDKTGSGVPPALMVTDFFNGHMGPDDPAQQAEATSRSLAWMMFAMGDK